MKFEVGKLYRCKFMRMNNFIAEYAGIRKGHRDNEVHTFIEPKENGKQEEIVLVTINIGQRDKWSIKPIK